MSNATKLPNAKRAENYMRQNLMDRGNPQYSNRQIRRMAKHARKNLERIQQVAKATFKTDEIPALPEMDEHNIPESEMNEIIESLEAPMEEFVEVEPPAEKRPCGGTDHCVTPSGAKAKSTHKKCEAFA